jgi:RNA polymerase sigma-70 factor (ECF subfamily)
MPDQSTQHLNSELPARAREHRERELVERIDARDREAMRDFCLLYYHRLARFLCRLTPRHDLIDEMINDILVVVWENASNFRGNSRVSTWIMGIAYRRGLNLLRSECRTQATTVLPPTEDQHLQNPVAEQSELAELLECAFESLSPDHRAVLELVYDLGHSYGEIAAIMDCPINTVKTRMFEARSKLRGLVPIPAAPRGEAQAYPRITWS